MAGIRPELAYRKRSTGEPHWAAKASAASRGSRTCAPFLTRLDRLPLVLVLWRHSGIRYLVLDSTTPQRSIVVHLPFFRSRCLTLVPRSSLLSQSQVPVKKEVPECTSSYCSTPYAFDSECDAGELGLDECLANTYQRVPAIIALNIGSRSVHSSSQDCLPSANPLLATNGVTECYWTERAFGGWQGKSPKAGAYRPILTFFGF